MNDGFLFLVTFAVVVLKVSSISLQVHIQTNGRASEALIWLLLLAEQWKQTVCIIKKLSRSVTVVGSFSSILNACVVAEFGFWGTRGLGEGSAGGCKCCTCC